MIKNYYAVRKGRKNNVVVQSWDECSELVTGYPGAIYKGFSVWQKGDAIKFAQTGGYGKHTPKIKPVAKNKPNKQWGKCLERKSYRDPFTNIYYKNRCVVKFIATVVGANYQPNNETSIPWAA